jgi:hypothetical protein
MPEHKSLTGNYEFIENIRRKLVGKRSLVRPRRTCKNNVKMYQYFKVGMCEWLK